MNERRDVDKLPLKEHYQFLINFKTEDEYGRKQFYAALTEIAKF